MCYGSAVKGLVQFLLFPFFTVVFDVYRDSRVSEQQPVGFAIFVLYEKEHSLREEEK